MIWWLVLAAINWATIMALITQAYGKGVLFLVIVSNILIICGFLIIIYGGDNGNP